MVVNNRLQDLLLADVRAAFGRDCNLGPKQATRSSPEFEIVYWFRLASATDNTLLRPYYQWRYRRLRIRRHVTLIPGTQIGPGFRIGHLGALVVHPKAVLGEDITLCQGVTIGKIHSGRRQGVPRLGSHLYLAANAVVIGGIQIGNHVVISPNAFVNFDVPDHSIVLGNPGVIHRKEFPTVGMSNLLRESGVQASVCTETPEIGKH
jgi:serine O-acetyltransferase